MNSLNLNKLYSLLVNINLASECRKIKILVDSVLYETNLMQNAQRSFIRLKISFLVDHPFE